MRWGFLIWSWFICQICGHLYGLFRNLPAMPQRVSPLTTVYESGASGCRSACVTWVAPADPCFSAGFPGDGGIPSANAPPGTKLAKATTKVIIVFRMAVLTCGYGARDPYSEKGLRPLFHVVQ